MTDDAHGRSKKEVLHVEHAMFCIISQPGTKYNLRAYRVDESFWTKKQSCITQKVGQKSGVCFSILFVLVDAILLILNLQKRTSVKNFF